MVQINERYVDYYFLVGDTGGIFLLLVRRCIPLPCTFWSSAVFATTFVIEDYYPRTDWKKSETKTRH